MFFVAAAVIAHQGGWDEILFVAAPLIVFAGLLYLANKRADKQGTADESAKKPAAKGSNPAKGSDTPKDKSNERR